MYSTLRNEAMSIISTKSFYELYQGTYANPVKTQL